MRIGKTIYFDHHATTPVDPRVLAEMIPFFNDFFGNPHSADHYLGWGASRAVEGATNRVAQLIGADADEIIFTSGATEANNLALLGLASHHLNHERHRILLGAIEHKCVLSAGRALKERHGFEVQMIPVDHYGFIDVDQLEKMLDSDVLAVSIMAVNNEIGTIQNLGAISPLVRSFGAVLHCDAAQAPIALNMRGFCELTDTISLSAHKIYGPQGIGAIRIPRQLHDRIDPIIFGGGQQNGLRSGTVPLPLSVGMGAAATLLMTEAMELRRAELRHRRDIFVEKLGGLPFPIELNGPTGCTSHPGNANVRFVGFSAHDILGSLQPLLAASTGSACTSGIPEPSHVLKAIGLGHKEAESSVRFSLGFGTTDEDVDDAISLIEDALAKLAKNGLMDSE